MPWYPSGHARSGSRGSCCWLSVSPPSRARELQMGTNEVQAKEPDGDSEGAEELSIDQRVQNVETGVPYIGHIPPCLGDFAVILERPDCIEDQIGDGTELIQGALQAEI